ncbi:MAG: hypothetical protein KDE55_22045, partial [Novosphingobium sp.]|nr:hypothetical protein [Novosphingobium sp.]
MIYNILHRSRIGYDVAVKHARFNLRLQPVSWPGQTILSQSLTWSPQASEVREQQGPYPVNTTRLQYDKPLTELSLEFRLRIDVQTIPAPDSGPSLGDVGHQAIAATDLSSLSPAPYLFASRTAEFDSAITRWAAPFLERETDIIAAATA